MITNAILALLYGVMLLLTFPLRSLSDVVIDPSIVSAISDASVALGTLSTVFPVTALLTVTGLYLATELSILVWHGANWLIRKIPTVN
jgi:hypothetical protein